MAIGIALGVAFMPMMGPAGIAIGVGIGVALGAAFSENREGDDGDEQPDSSGEDEPEWPSGDPDA